MIFTRAKAVIKRGDIITIRPEWQDAGDASFTWVARNDEENGRVDISAVELAYAATWSKPPPLPIRSRIPRPLLKSQWGITMKDYQASLEKLRKDAAEAALSRDLATAKQDRFDRLHQHLIFNRLADEVERAMAEREVAAQLAASFVS